MFFLQDCTGIIDFREYLLGVLIISKASNVAETVELAFKVMYYSGFFSFPIWPRITGMTCHNIYKQKYIFFKFSEQQF
jgi:hypothetical protein